jgi:ADP-heptose:LPS heptosyltransferase
VNSPPKILIINLTRLGDILQSTPLLRALKSHDPAGEIQYLAVDRFAEVCRHIPEIDEVIPFSFDSALAVSKDAVRQLPRRLKEVEDFVQSLRHRNFDTVINLSHSRISALICHLLNVQDTRGLTLDREGFRQIRQPWANYFFTANLNRTFNRFNLVDVNLGLAWAEGSGAEAKNVPWTAGGGSLSFQISPDARLQARQLLKSDNDCAARLRIGFQPGASLPNKRWPTDSFVELGKLLKDSCKAQIAIFGSKAEVGLGEAIEQSLNGEI